MWGISRQALLSLQRLAREIGLQISNVVRYFLPHIFALVPGFAPLPLQVSQLS